MSHSSVTASCGVAGCGRKQFFRGYCTTHYKRLLSTGDVQADVPIVRGRPPMVIRDAGVTKCFVGKCEREIYSRGVCSTHYKRLRRTGDVWAAVPIGKPGQRVAVEQ